MKRALMLTLAWFCLLTAPVWADAPAAVSYETDLQTAPTPTSTPAATATPRPTPIEPVNPTAFLFTDEGAWAALGSAAGILYFDPNTGEVLDRFTSEAGPEADVQAVAQDGDGNLYFAALNGLHIFSEGEPSLLLGEADLGSDAIHAVVADPGGPIWAATEGGIAVWSEGEWLLYTSKEGGWRDPYGYPGDLVTSLAIDRDLNVWAAIWDVGVVSYDGNMWVTYTVEDGLPTAEIHAIAADGMGSIWAATARGLARLAPDADRWTVAAGARAFRQPDLRGLLPAGDALWLWDADGAAVRIDRPGQPGQKITRLTTPLADEGQVVYVTGLGVDPGGRVWFAHADGHLSVYDGQLVPVRVKVLNLAGASGQGAGGLQHHESAAAGYALDYPLGWTITNDEEDGTLWLEADDQLLAFFLEPMDLPVPVRVGVAGPILGLETVTRLFVEGFKGEIGDLTITETFTRTVDGQPAVVHRAQFVASPGAWHREPDSHLKMDAYLAITLKDQMAYAFVTVAQRGDAEVARDALDQFLNGFYFGAPAEPEPEPALLPTAEYEALTVEEQELSLAYPAGWELVKQDEGLIVFSPGPNDPSWYALIRYDLEEPATADDVERAIQTVLEEAVEINPLIVLWRNVSEDARYVEVVDTSAGYVERMHTALLAYPVDRSVIILGLSFPTGRWTEGSLLYRDLFGQVEVAGQAAPLDELPGAGLPLYTYHGVVSFHLPASWQVEDRGDDAPLGPDRPDFLLVAGPELPRGFSFKPVAGPLLLAEGVQDPYRRDDGTLVGYLLDRLARLYLVPVRVKVRPSTSSRPISLNDGGVFLSLGDAGIAGEPGYRLDAWAYESGDHLLFVALSSPAEEWDAQMAATADTLFINPGRLSTLLTPKPANLLTELPAATTALTTTNASAIAFISDTVWLALPPDHGLAGWWAADTQFLGYAAPDGESLSEIAARTLATDGDGRLWAGGKGGISLWDGQEWQVARQPASALAFDAEGQLWAAQRDQLWRWDGQRWQLSGKLSGRVRIADLALAPDGTLWAATDDGVARYDGADWAWAEGFPEGYAPVHAIAADRRGRVWVAAAGGVARFDGEGWTAYDVGIGPRAEPVSIAVDVRGHVWVGYGSVAVAAGVDQFNGLRWIAHRYGIMERVGIEEIVLGPDDALWMVVRDAAALTTSAGLYRFDGRNWVLYPLP